MTYTVSGGWMDGLQIKARGALVDLEGPPGVLPGLRLILNWPLPLLWAILIAVGPRDDVGSSPAGPRMRDPSGPSAFLSVGAD